MKKFGLLFCAFLMVNFSFTRSVNADFGATALAVMKLIGVTLKELSELKKIIETGKDTLRILNDVNRGIHDVVHLADNLEDTLKSGSWGDLSTDIQRIVYQVDAIYGAIPDTPRKEMQKVVDDSIVDAIQRHNQIYENIESSKSERRWLEAELRSNPSPGRSTQLQANIQFELLQALNRIEKNQALTMKLMAQQLGMENSLDKSRSAEAQYMYKSLEKSFNQLKFNTSLPVN